MTEQSLTTFGIVSAQHLMNALPRPMVVIDQSGKIIAVNQAWQQRYQHELPQMFLGQDYFDIFQMMHQQDVDHMQLCRQGIEEAVGGKRPLFRFDYRESDGFHTLMVLPLGESFQGAVISYLDDSENREVDAQMTMLLESPLDGILVIDPQGLIQMVNASLERMFGYSRDELFGQCMEILLPHRFRRQHRQHLEHYLASPRMRPMGTGLELWGLHKDGHEFPVEISLNPLETTGTKLVSAAIRDVSAKMQSEQQLARLAKILETSAGEIYLCDAQTLRFTFANQGACKNVGYSSEELRNLTPLDLVPDFDLAGFEKVVAPLRNHSEDLLHFSTQCQRKDGSRYPIDVYLQLFERESPPVFAAVAFDISEREAAQKALRESQKRLAAHVANTPLAVLEWRTSDGIITAWNAAAERIFGYKADEVIGQRHANFIVPEEQRQSLEATFRGSITSSGVRSTNQNLTQDGRVILCEWYNTLLEDNDSEEVYMSALALDVTARQRALSDLLSTQEAERGRIARDLHDQVGQSLTGLLLGLNAVQSPDKSKLEELKGLAQGILGDVRRISRDLRPALLDELGLEASLKRFAREFAQPTGLAVDVLIRVPDRLDHDTKIVIYRVAQEALTNIVRHAQAHHASIVVTLADNALHLVIEDDGVGFDVSKVQVSSHVGLASMRERVELFGGAFTTESLEGKGTTISVRLPLG